MAIFYFWPFLHPVFSACYVRHISDTHSKFALRRHHVWKYDRLYGPTFNLRWLTLGEEKTKTKEEERNQRAKI